jgi:hypothetical protein
MRIVAVAAVVFMMAGCASAPRSAPENGELHDSSLEISFVRGHNLHRLFAQAHERDVKAQSFMDRELLKEKPVSGEKYLLLLTRVQEFVAARQPAAEDSGCRTPYSITIRIGANPRTLHGCRSETEGAQAGTGLGKIVREAEFLLYSSP